MNRVKTIIRNNKFLLCVEDYLAPYGISWQDVKKLLLLDENDNPPPIELYFNNWNDYFYKEEIAGCHGGIVNHYLIYHLLTLIINLKTGKKHNEDF